MVVATRRLVHTYTDRESGHLFPLFGSGVARQFGLASWIQKGSGSWGRFAVAVGRLETFSSCSDVLGNLYIDIRIMTINLAKTYSFSPI